MPKFLEICAQLERDKNTHSDLVKHSESIDFNLIKQNEWTRWIDFGPLLMDQISNLFEQIQQLNLIFEQIENKFVQISFTSITSKEITLKTQLETIKWNYNEKSTLIKNMFINIQTHTIRLIDGSIEDPTLSKPILEMLHTYKRIIYEKMDWLIHKYISTNNKYIELNERIITLHYNYLYTKTKIIYHPINSEPTDSVIDQIITMIDGTKELTKNDYQIIQQLGYNISDLKIRHNVFIQLENSLFELYQMFIFISILISKQGLIINTIEQQVNQHIPYSVLSRDGNATKSTRTPGTEFTRTPGTEFTRTPGTEFTRTPGTEFTRTPGTEFTRTPGTESTRTPGTEFTRTPGTEFTRTPGTESTLIVRKSCCVLQ